MLMREGVSGYGVYWMLLEMLRDSENLSMFYFPESFAYALHCQDVGLVERVCRDYGLFEFDKDDNMSSPWLNRAMGAYSDKKAALQEAGRRGAAKRWGKAAASDSHPIATPSLEDSHPIAYNITQPNITLHNPTPSGAGSGRVISEDFVKEMVSHSPSGCSWGYIAQVCFSYGMVEEDCFRLIEAVDNGSLSSSKYRTFVDTVKRIQTDKFRPKHPLKFFLSKIQ